MSEPTYTQFTERMYARLPEVMREADALNDFALKRYISAIGDVEDQVERLIARFTYLSKQDRLSLGALNDDYNYYDLDWRYFQSTDSKNSAVITTREAPAFLRTLEAYRVVPNTVIYTGSVFRTDVAETTNSYGLRLWYYDASMELQTFRDVARNNGSVGPQWVVLNATDQVPDGAYYVRVSPFTNNSTGTNSRVWVDDVYVRSHYEVTTTNNLVSSGHNFTMRTEREMIQQGDFDDAWDINDLTEWDLGPEVKLIERSLTGVPDIQSYRYWLSLDSTAPEQPGYARQVVHSVEPSATYTISMLMVRDANVLDAESIRVTITPNTGGPTTRSFTMEGYEKNVPALLTFTWNSPESVTNAIVSVEHIGATEPATVPLGGVLINDVSVVRYNPNISQLGRSGDPATITATERAGAELLASGDIRSGEWIRYATGGDPEEPLDPSVPDSASGTSFIEAQWRQTRPENTYTFSGEVNTDDAGAYADLIIWYRTDGKGWGEAMLHRISTSVMNNWARFERTIVIPDGATEFRINLDAYRTNNSRRLDIRGLSLTSPVDRSWYMTGSRPFSFNALATRSLNFLSRGDLLHYTADLLVTGDPSFGRYGVRIYAGENQLVHETVITPSGRNELIQITGAFQVPESLMELRAAFYVNDPTPRHQAAYFLSNLEIVHSSQQFVEDPQNLIRNGGFEFTDPLEGWNLLAEREMVRRNRVPNPAGPSMTDTSNWRSTSGDTLEVVQDTGRPVLKLTEGGTNEATYLDPSKNLTDVPVGTVIRFSADVKVTTDTEQMRLLIGMYGGAARTGGGTGWIVQKVTDGWVRYTTEAVVTESPEGGYFRTLIWPSNGTVPVGQSILVRDVMVEYNTDGQFFDRYTPSSALAQYAWDSTKQEHIERRLTYNPPVSLPMTVGVDTGYNLEDVPDRPEDVPLGATSDLVDPRTANTEWLPWLAQFTGHDIGHFATLEDAREAFSATESNFATGTIRAIQNAVATVLTGSRTVRVFPMTTDLSQRGQATQWDVSIVTRTSESPSPEVMKQAVVTRNAKPAGVVFHFHLHQSTWDAVELDNPTWDVWDTRTWTQLEESGLGS